VSAGSVIGLDYGAKTVGVAATDGLGLTAQPLETIFREKESHLRPTLRRIEAIAKERGAELIVVGLPVNMDGSEGERAKAARAFGAELERRLKLPVKFADERLTTFEADGILDEMGVAARDRKKYIDKIAAALILEEYMKSGGPRGEKL